MAWSDNVSWWIMIGFMYLIHMVTSRLVKQASHWDCIISWLFSWRLRFDWEEFRKCTVHSHTTLSLVLLNCIALSHFCWPNEDKVKAFVFGFRYSTSTWRHASYFDSTKDLVPIFQAIRSKGIWRMPSLYSFQYTWLPFPQHSRCQSQRYVTQDTALCQLSWSWYTEQVFSTWKDTTCTQGAQALAFQYTQRTLPTSAGRCKGA